MSTESKTVTVTLIQRQPRHSERQRLLEHETQVVLESTLPLSMRGYDANTLCPYCGETRAQWYIFAVKTQVEMGLTNGVCPGLKCNSCKEGFMRQYLRPNWVIEDERSLPGQQQWQKYCIVPLQVQTADVQACE